MTDTVIHYKIAGVMENIEHYYCGGVIAFARTRKRSETTVRTAFETKQ
jgi:hypothetical protein